MVFVFVLYTSHLNKNAKFSLASLSLSRRILRVVWEMNLTALNLCVIALSVEKPWFGHKMLERVIQSLRVTFYVDRFSWRYLEQ